MFRLFEKIKKNISIYSIKEFRLLGVTWCWRLSNLLDRSWNFYIFGIRVFKRNTSKKQVFINEPLLCVKEGLSEKSEIARVSIIIDLMGDNDISFITLDSMSTQLFGSFEIIIVGTLAKEKFDYLVETCIAVNPNVVIYREKYIQSGIKRASGEYIAFCQNGDIWTPDYLERKAELAGKYERPIAIVNDIKFTGNKRYCRYLNVIVEDRRKFLKNGINRISDSVWRNKDILISPSCWMVKKSAFNSCNFSDISHSFLLYAWIWRQICPDSEIIYTPEELTLIQLSEKRLEKFSVDPLYREYQLIKGDYLLGYKAKIPVVFPEESQDIVRSFQKVVTDKRRLAIFASYNQHAAIDDYVVYYLRELSRVVDGIVFIMDNPVMPNEMEKISDYVIHVECKRHNEYDFGSYKRGFEYLKQNGFLKEADELVVCNDSCYGPFFSFEEMFRMMNARNNNSDFWGVSGNSTIKFHIQSFFYVFKKNVFESKCFSDFLLSIKEECDARGVVLNYEVELTEILQKNGFLYDTFIDYPITSTSIEKLVLDKCPLIKVKMVDNLSRKSEKSYKKFNSVVKKVNPALLKTIEKKSSGFGKQTHSGMLR